MVCLDGDWVVYFAIENQVLWASILCFTAERLNMITKIRLPQTLIPVSIVAVTMLGAVLLFPTANYASSGPGTPAPSEQKEHHNRLMNKSSHLKTIKYLATGTV